MRPASMSKIARRNASRQQVDQTPPPRRAGLEWTQPVLDRGRVGHTTSVPQAFRSPALPVQRTRKVRMCAIEEFDARPRRARYTNSRNERTTCQAACPAPAASGEQSSRPAVLSAGRTRDRARQPGLGVSQRGFRRDRDDAPGRQGSQEASRQAHRQETTRGGSAGRR